MEVNEDCLYKFGLEIVISLRSKLAHYQYESKKRIRESKNCALGGPIAEASGGAGINVGTTLAAGTGFPFLSTAGGSLMKTLYDYMINRHHREKAKKVCSLLGPSSPTVNEELFYRNQLHEFLTAVIQFTIAFRTQIRVIGNHTEWIRNFEKLAGVLVANFMNYVDDLPDAEFKATKDGVGVDSTVFLKGFIEGTPKGMKIFMSTFMETLSWGKIRAGRTLLTPSTQISDWKTVGMIMGPAVVDPSLDNPAGKPVVYQSKHTNVAEYGYRLALPYELENGYLGKLDYWPVSTALAPNEWEMFYEPVTQESLMSRMIAALNADNKDEQVPYKVEGDASRPLVYDQAATNQVLNYTERESLGREVLNALCDPPGAATKNLKISFTLVNIHGFGGNGKSQLAKKIFNVALTHHLFDGNAIWIHADEEVGPTRIRDQLNRFLATNDQPPPKDPSMLRDLVYGKILKNKECLLVLDNVTNVNTVLNNYLPTNGPGPNRNIKVLLTSQTPLADGQSGIIKNISVDVFTYEEATSYIKKFAGDVLNKEDLDSIFNATSRIPADLSLLCHSFQSMQADFGGGYTWPQHLESYGKFLASHNTPWDELPLGEQMEYRRSTKLNVATTALKLLNGVKKHNVGPVAIFILKNFAFCDGEEISLNEFVYRHSGIMSRIEECTLEGTKETKVKYVLSFLKKFGFTDEYQREQGQYEDTIITCHRAYQLAIMAIMSEQEEKSGSETAEHAYEFNLMNSVSDRISDKTVELRRDDTRSILVGLIHWIQIEQNVSNTFLHQKLRHAFFFWPHIEKNSDLLKMSTKTRDFLIALCMKGNTGGVQSWLTHCEQDSVATLLDNTYENVSFFYGPAVGRAVFSLKTLKDSENLETLTMLVRVVANRLMSIKGLDPDQGIFDLGPFKVMKSFFRSKPKKNKHTITQEEIHAAMLKIAFSSVYNWPAFEVILNNFPLRYYEPLETEEDRTLLIMAVKLKRSRDEVSAMVVSHDAMDEHHKKQFLNKKDANDRAALHHAVDLGLLPIVELLLEEGASVALKDGDFNTSLHIAVQCVKSKLVPDLSAEAILGIIKLLLDKSKTQIGCAHFVDEKDKNGMTALQLLCTSSDKWQVQVAELLLENDSNASELQTSTGRNLLHLAVDQRPPNFELFNFLMERHPFPFFSTEKDMDGNTPQDLLRRWEEDDRSD